MLHRQWGKVHLLLMGSEQRGRTVHPPTTTSRWRPLTFKSLFGKDEERSSVAVIVNVKHRDHEETEEAGGGVWRWGVGGASLDHLKVVQDGHDVLRHEDEAGVDGHASHRDQQGV